MRNFYALYDKENLQSPQDKYLKSRGCIEIKQKEAEDYNKQGFGIFWTVQEFAGPRRINNLKKILSWAVDIDGGDKKSMIDKFNKFLYPSLVIETKNGYHAYWHAKDGTAENYNSIVLDRLVYYFNSDPKARDISRILRAPNYFHLKNPKEPFLIKAVWEAPVAYTEQQMLYNFPIKNKAQVNHIEKKELKKVFSPNGDNLWERVYNLDCEQALERLSGKTCVGGETFSFQRTSGGCLNIFVNGKSTSCWIDRDKRIGSLDGGGPTIFQWINWYQRNKKRTYEIIKEEFSELFRK